MRGIPNMPHIPQDLVRFLTVKYPPRCKSPTESLEAHMEYAGKVNLINMLQVWHDQQNDVVLKKTMEGEKPQLDGNIAISREGIVKTFLETRNSNGPLGNKRRGKRIA